MTAVNIIIWLMSFYYSPTANMEAEFWGFYGHRLINRLAVFSLPPELAQIYKANIKYISEQSVAPDKRRYASVIEGIRHYIDLDVYPDVLMSDTLPDQYLSIFLKGEVHALSQRGDTLRTFSMEKSEEAFFGLRHALLYDIRAHLYALYESQYIVLSNDYKDHLDLPANTVSLIFQDHYSHYGILPYHLLDYQERLTRAMKGGDWKLSLRISAEMGHYISDAHVPLHTTRNYNGQLTDQLGIHAFWESRIPELMATEEFDFWVGKATYIEDKKDFFWNVIRSTHSLVKQVLHEDMLLRKNPDINAYCYEERNGVIVRLECEDYARLYAQKMNGMVEVQMQKSILATASAWFTAWVDAGKPTVAIVSLESVELEPTIDSPTSKNIRLHNN